MLKNNAMIIIVTAILFFQSSDIVRGNVQDARDMRDDRVPFAIELPEVGTGLLRATDYEEIALPAETTVRRIKLWVLKPYDRRFAYNLKATLNGKAMGTNAEKKSGQFGNYLDLDLRQPQSPKLNDRKNFLEFSAIETESHITYRCSFVLRPGAGQRARSFEPEIRIEKVSAWSDIPIPGENRNFPELTLTTPAKVPEASGESFELRVSGYARDDEGRLVSVSLNGEIIASPPPAVPADKKGKRSGVLAAARLNFDKTVRVGPEVAGVLLEARDQAGNRTLAHIPIRRAEMALAGNGFGGRRYAVVIGISKYRFNEGGLNNLQFAARDAEAIRDFLMTRDGGSFASDDIVCLTDENATKASVWAQITRHLTKAGPNDLVYLFLGGHGAPDKYDPQRLYFLLHDSKVNDLEGTALSMEKLGEFLADKLSNGRLISFFDTCHSAGIDRRLPAGSGKGRVTGATGLKGIGVKPGMTSPISDAGGKPPASSPIGRESSYQYYNAPLFSAKGWSVISSSSRSEYSQEGARWGEGHGVFTWTILEGLKGKADKNQDCNVTAAELSDYVRRRVSEETNGDQNPQTLPGSSGGMVLSAVPASACRR